MFWNAIWSLRFYNFPGSRASSCGVKLLVKNRAWMNEATFVHIYMLHWAKRTSWGCWDESDDIALLAQYRTRNRSPRELATSRSLRLPTVPSTNEWGRSFCFFEIWLYQTSGRTRQWTPAGQTAAFNHCTRAPMWIKFKTAWRNPTCIQNDSGG